MRIGSCMLDGRTGHEAGLALLAQLYKEETGEPLPEIRLGQWGKPYFVNSPWQFSITHTPRHAFCVLTREPVGIDAEELDRPISASLVRRVLSPIEYAQYAAAQDKRRAFLTFWVLKEAQVKRTGRGLQGFPNHTNFRLEDAQVFEMDGCLVAIDREACRGDYQSPGDIP